MNISKIVNDKTHWLRGSGSNFYIKKILYFLSTFFFCSLILGGKPKYSVHGIDEKESLFQNCEVHDPWVRGFVIKVGL